MTGKQIAAGRTRIKICCIGSMEEAHLAIRCGADAIGLVGVTPPNPRTLDDQVIAAIASTVPPPIASVLLTSASTALGIAEHARKTSPSAVQIVCQIDPVESQRLAALLPATGRVQVIHVEDERVLDLIPAYAPHIHAFLLDSGRPGLPTPGYGGTGRVHDWTVSAEFVRRSPVPVFLAGGLSGSNVGNAIRTVRPFGVDLCSGVRTDGRLDHAKLAAFMGAVRLADAAADSAASKLT
ncbi:MAG TPA: phosphoribosylanthranilate isomerase [Steroidobacteraceae bacterium]|nr:phosphoribosylanthranilate isomerase [Steroidobacteraceae bacterium]